VDTLAFSATPSQGEGEEIASTGERKPRAFRFAEEPSNLGYQRKPQLVERFPPIKKLGENKRSKVSLHRNNTVQCLRPEHLRGISCIAYHVANRKGELFRLEWSDVELDGNPPVFTSLAGETKNNDGRTLPILTGEMMDTLRRLKAERDDVARCEARIFKRRWQSTRTPHDA
jgi:hypothetical protein